MLSATPLAYNVIAKPIGAVCNLACKYCYYLEKRNIYGTVKDFRMPEGLLEIFIKQYIETNQVPVVTFAWQGGEPTLLGLDYFRNVIAIQKKYANGKKILNAFQTNGIRLDDKWCSFFSGNDILVGISIDGPRKIHDQYRKTPSGGGTFKKVMGGLKYLKKHNVQFNTLTAVTRYNQNAGHEVYRFLKEIGSRYIQFIPIVERTAQQSKKWSPNPLNPSRVRDKAVAPWAVQPEAYGKFLITVFDEWVRKDVGQYSVQIIDVTLENWVGIMPSLCLFAERCGTALAIEHNGDVYSCDHFVYPEYRLGNVMCTRIVDLVRSPIQIAFGNNKNDCLPMQCQQCDVRFACHGECPKNRFMTTINGDNRLNYLCKSYLAFFHYVAPYMEYMASEILSGRSYASIMRMINDKQTINSNKCMILGNA